MYKKRILIYVAVAVILFFAGTQVSLAFPGVPLVPCGQNQDDPRSQGWDESQPCNSCLLLKLGRNVFDFVAFGFVPILATLFFVVAGIFILMGGAQPDLLNRGKAIFKGTFYGLLIIYSSWLLANTVINSLNVQGSTQADQWYQFTCTTTVYTASYSCDPSGACIIDPNGSFTDPLVCANNCTPTTTTVPPPVGGALTISTASLPNGQPNVSYTTTLQATGGSGTGYTWFLASGNFPPGLNFSTSTGDISGTPTQTGTFTFTVKVRDSQGATATKQLTLTVSTVVATNCGNPDLVCGSLTCRAWIDRTYESLIPKVAAAHPIPGVNTVKMLTAIMRMESQGRIGVSSPAGAYGLMQFLVGTAKQVSQRCGVSSDTVTANWLMGVGQTAAEKLKTAEAQICMAAEYIKDLSNYSCYKNNPQKQIRDLAAAYNAGPDSCNARTTLAQSNSCSSQATANPTYANDCSNRPTLVYECLWEDYAHKVCNTGYRETRDYAAMFNNCYGL